MRRWNSGSEENSTWWLRRLTYLLGIDVIIKPLITCITFGLVGMLNIYVLLMVPGLYRGMGATTIVHNVASGATSAFIPKQEDPAARWGK